MENMALTQPKLKMFKIGLLHPTSFDHLCSVARYNIIHSLIPKHSQLPPPPPPLPPTHTYAHTLLSYKH